MKRPIKVKDILLVEDDPGSARLTELAIERSGASFSVTLATSGNQALKILRRQGQYKNAAQPDLVLLDITLPEMNGWEVLRDIRSDPKLMELAVVVLTVSKDDRYVQKCYDLQADGFINKPMNTEKFHGLIDSDDIFTLSIEPLSPEQVPPDIWY